MGSALRNRARLQRDTVAFTVEDLGHAPVARVGRSEAQRSARLQCTLQAHLQVIDADVDARTVDGGQRVGPRTSAMLAPAASSENGR